jgi:hypothetical protein
LHIILIISAPDIAEMCLIYSLTFKDCQHVHHLVIEQHEPAIYCSDVKIEHQGESMEAAVCPDCSRRAIEIKVCNGSAEPKDREEQAMGAEKAGKAT